MACALLLWAAGGVAGQVHFPRPPLHRAITLRADAASRWAQGAYEVNRLQGSVVIAQGANLIRGDDAVVWVQHGGVPGEATKVIAYLEGAGDRPVAVELYQSAAERQAAGSQAVARQQAGSWFGRLWTVAALDWQTPDPTPPPAEAPGILQRGFAHFATPPVEPPPGGVRLAQAIGGDAAGDPGAQHAAAGVVGVPPPGGDRSAVLPAQFQQPFVPAFPQPTVPPPGPSVPNAAGFRQIDIYPRSEVGGSAEYRPQQGVGVVTGGVNVIIQGIQAPGGGPMALAGPSGGPAGGLEKIDLETDRAVIWTAPGGVGNSFQQRNDTPLEIYMEGNIVFRQGDRIIYADRMYYDARRQVGVVLNAELLTPLPEVEGFRYRGLVRLKAGVLRQLDESRYVATDARFTTSRWEEPSYALRSGTITLEDNRRPVTDPATGITTFTPDRLARSQNNFIEFGGVPLFYWPTIATNLEEPVFYISDFRVGNDQIFGFQTLVDFDVFQLLGLEGPPGVDWDLSIDYLSDRGLGYGTEVDYAVDRFLGFSGPSAGRLDAWAIDDGGLDNLGFGRREITPESAYRGRLYWNHRQRFVDGLLQGWVAQAEVGWISDRTFLEQYYETEWDQNKDQTTGVRLRRLFDNQSVSIEANARINDFFTQTQWLPRLDHYLLGQDVAGGAATWFAHSQAAYANLKPASTATSPGLAPPAFVLFPWEANTEGERVATRQEIDLPLNLEPVKIVPYALGEVAHWGADLTGDDLQRAYLQTGVRASTSLWAVNPLVRDPLFNLNGLAHKVVLEADISYADSSRNFDELPLYDPLDDDSIEEVRRSLFTAPLPVPFAPAEFDPRFYAIRTGLQRWVTAPTTELVEDQTVVRLGMRHRLQTKRGAPGRQRIVDWLTFDSNLSLVPDADRDNFGEELGLLDYRLQWNLGDRFSIVSDGFADVFDNGLRTISAGVRTNRPTRGNAYLGYRSISGPFNAQLLTATVNYRLGPKWAASGSTVIDFGNAGNIGQAFSLSRIGESIIVTVGVRVDESKDNVGFNFLVEPRFLPRLSLTRRGGIDIPPAGFEYLE
ncbi:MAG: organic solvent tolerance protein OstA [Planctomycetota bacterium]